MILIKIKNLTGTYFSKNLKLILKTATKVGITTAFFGFLSCGLFSCTKGKSLAEKSIETQELHIGNGTEPKDLDPQIVTGVPEHHIIEALFEGLVATNPKDASPEPGVAETWNISKDQKTYTFHLRHTAKWSNGNPLTAHDFEYSWKRILSPKLASEYAYMLHYVKNAKGYNEGKINDFSKVGAKALDDYTFQVTLEYPTPFFLSILQHPSTYAVHKATIEKFGAMDEQGTKWTRAENIVSNGPFILENWELNKIITVKKNPLYWDAGVVKLNKIHFYPTESEQTEERSFRAGKLHKSNTVPIDKITVYKKEHPELIHIEPYLGTYYYRMNVTKKPLNDVRVRRALQMAIDRVTIVENVTKGGQLPAYSFVPPDLAGYNSQNKIPYDPEQARKLLAEAGYPNGKNFPETDLLYNTSESHKVIAEALQQMWKKELNIHIGLSNQDWKVYLSSQKSLDYNISRAGWIGDYPDPNTFMDMFVTDGGNNQTGWSNKQYDNLIAKAATVSDTGKRLEVFQQAEKILIEDGPIIPIYTYTRVYLMSPYIKGWYGNIMDWHPYKYIYLSKEK